MTVKAISFVAKEHNPTRVAVASSEPFKPDVPVLDINDAGAVADFIEERFQK